MVVNSPRICTLAARDIILERKLLPWIWLFEAREFSGAVWTLGYNANKKATCEETTASFRTCVFCSVQLFLPPAKRPNISSDISGVKALKNASSTTDIFHGVVYAMTLKASLAREDYEDGTARLQSWSRVAKNGCLGLFVLHCWNQECNNNWYRDGNGQRIPLLCCDLVLQCLPVVRSYTL